MASESLTGSLRETLAAFEEAGAPLTTPEVATSLDLGRRTAYARLERLVERDRLETKKVGANARVWWRPRATDDDDERPGQVSRWEQQFRSLVQATEEYAIFMLDADGYVRTWNPGAERIKGYDADDIVGDHFSTFYTEDDRAADIPERNLTTAAEEGSIQDEGWRLRADGTRFWANVTITAIRDDDDRLVGFAKVTRSMTDRREYERRLKEEKSFVQSLLNSQQDLFYAFDADGEFLRWNDRVNEVTGYTDAELETMRPADLVADGAVEKTRAAVEEVLDGDRLTVELPLITAEREAIPYEFTSRPLTDETGDIVGFTGVGRDISERKARERRLERQQADLRAELDDIFERIDEAFFALDTDGLVTYVNDRAAEILQSSVGELTGARLQRVLPGATDGDPRERIERSLETQEPVEFEFYADAFERWIEVRGYPSETGVSVYFRDVTGRKERERDLELYETIFETVEDGIYVLDEDFRFTRVNDAYVEMTGYDRDELLGAHSSVVISAEVAARSFEMTQALDDEGGSAVLEADIQRADGDTLRAESRFTTLPSGGTRRNVGIVRDVGERVARERELEQYERMVETVDDGIYVLDEDSRFAAVNDALCALTGYDREELLGAHATRITDEEAVASGETSVTAPDADERAAPMETTIRTRGGETVPVENRVARFDFDGEERGRIGSIRDVSERKERERELRNRIRQQEAVSTLGQHALADRDLDSLLAEASDVVAETLYNDYCKVLDLDSDAEELLLRQGVGWDEGIVGEATVSSVEDDSQAAYTLRTEGPVVVSDLATETRFSGPDLLTSHDVRSGISTIIGSGDDPWGILGTHDTAPKDFSAHDALFVQSVANILATAVERHRHEQTLLDQREQITALNNVNEVVRGITGAVIDQSTRDEIEQTVCDRLAGSGSYQFAWIGDVETGSRTVTLRTEAGVEGYLDDTTISLDPDDERGRGPTGRAFRTGEMQTTHDARNDSRYEPWRGLSEAYDFRSSAAIPIVHEGTTYGVLNVYADRHSAFEGREREVLAQLGEIVGHAIAATERKQALLSDEVVELEFRIEGVLDALGIDAAADGSVRLDHTVMVGDDEFLLFGHTTPEGVDTVEAMVAAIPFYEDVTFRDGDDGVQFELRMSEPPVLSVLASLGGSVEEAVIEGGDYRLVVHLSPSADVRQLIDAVTETYPSANLLKRRQLTRDARDVESDARALATDLTDRQRTALETAYFAGFFEWPRDASGEDVAESLDVAPPTFHQHLRKAERKVFESLLSSPA